MTSGFREPQATTQLREGPRFLYSPSDTSVKDSTFAKRFFFDYLFGYFAL